jgi:peptidoglycan hydrolase-like protein with peptidoglycan-binding domain
VNHIDPSGNIPIDADGHTVIEYGYAYNPNATTSSGKTQSLSDVQRKLNQLGYVGSNGKPLVVDGKNGPNTQFAVKAFQNKAGLSADGIAGTKTKQVLFGALTPRNVTMAPKPDTTNKTTSMKTNQISHPSNSYISSKTQQASAQQAVARCGVSKDQIYANMGWKRVSSGIYSVLDIVGLIPGVGEIPDGINGAFYLLEGDKRNAVLSAAAMVPFSGWAGTGEKYILKYGDEVIEVDKSLLSKSAKGTGNLTDLMKKKSLGRGSTGRTTPNNLDEQLAMKEVLSNPLDGATAVPTKNMNDPRWLGSEGWVKMQKFIKTSNGKINIHFNYNTKTGKFDDFKFK